MDLLTLSEIWIYPIKSLAGISLQQWKVKQKGLQFDRRWMLVDEEGIFMTQRSTTQLALFKTALSDNKLTIQHSGDTRYLPLDQPAEGKSFMAKVWEDTVEVIEVDKSLSDWFSEKTGIRCRLVSFPEENKRAVEPGYSTGHEVSLADAYPFLIIGTQSLEELNSRLNEPVEMKRFRPNFVFTGGNPFVEDTWKNISIGTMHFVAVKPCARCVLITVDPETGKKGAEPLKTLATYRTTNNKVLFGQNLVTLGEGEVKVGDKIQIQ